MEECLLYSDPELYDLLFPSAREAAALADESRKSRILASNQFYLEEAGRGGGQVLELACGSGRLTVQLAQNGIDIVGADLSATMLDAARAKAEAAGLAVEFLLADMRSFDFGRQFSTILVPGNSLLHLLTLDDLKRCLGCVRRHLVEGGRLVFDVSKWDLSVLMREPETRYPVPTAGQITVEEMAHYDSARQIRHITWFFSVVDAPDYRVAKYDLRVICPEELLLLLDCAGFRLEARYGEFTRVPFEDASPRQVCVARAG
jgi:SAM-dependent methyltransferase